MFGIFKRVKELEQQVIALEALLDEEIDEIYGNLLFVAKKADGESKPKKAAPKKKAVNPTTKELREVLGNISMKLPKNFGEVKAK